MPGPEQLMLIPGFLIFLRLAHLSMTLLPKPSCQSRGLSCITEESKRKMHSYTILLLYAILSLVRQIPSSEYKSDEILDIFSRDQKGPHSLV